MCPFCFLTTRIEGSLVLLVWSLCNNILSVNWKSPDTFYYFYVQSINHTLQNFINSIFIKLVFLSHFLCPFFLWCSRKPIWHYRPAAIQTIATALVSEETSTEQFSSMTEVVLKILYVRLFSCFIQSVKLHLCTRITTILK